MRWSDGRRRVKRPRGVRIAGERREEVGGRR
jgi:hypothetical protein